MLLQQVEQLEQPPVEVYQAEYELTGLRQIIAELSPTHILEIGSLYGGTLWCWMHDNPGANVVSIDLVVGQPDHRAEDIYAARALWGGWAEKYHIQLSAIEGDSRDHGVIEQVTIRQPYDFIFIDGGHDIRTVRTDFANYWPMLRTGGILAFHDIAYPEGNADGIEVPRVWREAREEAREWVEIIRPGVANPWWGIGLMLK